MRLIKFVCMFFCIVCYILTSFLVTKKFCHLITSFYCKIAIKILNIKIHTTYTTLDSIPLIVSNHVSYLDILVLSSIYPSIFITSKELQQDKFLGLLAKLAGCVFVERRDNSSIFKDIEKITSLLNSVPVILFPEATSSNGEKVLQFKSTLFKSIENTNIPVLPICIKYISFDNHRITDENRDQIYYYNDMKFFSHFLNLLKISNIEIRATFLDKIQEKDRKETCKLAYEQINNCYKE